jgi:nucleotide-binding universal stress UspA family protein
MYERLLLASDGSDLAVSAMRHAAALARAMGSEVVAMRVSHAAGEAAGSLTPEAWTRVIAAGGVEQPGEAGAEAYPPLSLTAAALKESGVDRVGTLVVRGEPGPVVIEAATRLRADAIVMATHGLRGIRRAVLGSVADHVARNSPGISVLLCPPLPGEVQPSINRIMVALDGSPLSEALLPHAEEIAGGSGASVVLLRVIDSAVEILSMTTPAGYPVPARLTQEAAETVVQAQRTTAEEQLSAHAAHLEAAGVGTVSTEIVEGDPGPAIIATATDLQCDLVLLATHGRGGLGRALLGSVTDYVTRHLTSAPVLIVSPGRKS